MTITMSPAYKTEEERIRNREHAVRVCTALREKVYKRWAEERANSADRKEG